jgi:hypothetical protein
MGLAVLDGLNSGEKRRLAGAAASALAAAALPAVADAGCTHERIVTGSGRKAARHPAFKAVNTVLGNIKSAIAATFRSGSKKHAPRRLAEFEYRFNRRYDLPAMMPRLGCVAVRTPPMPYRLLTLAEDYG